MSAYAREKGAVGEREVVQILRSYGFDAHRTQNVGGDQRLRGDITGLPGVYNEVKWHKKLEPQRWWRETYERANNAPGIPMPLLWMRSNRGVWLTVTDPHDLLPLLQQRNQ